MSDFLTHLASRAVAPATAVRPLVRSTYQPQTVNEFKLPEARWASAIQGFQSLPTGQPSPPLTPGRDSGIIDHKDAPRSPQPVSPVIAWIHESPSAIVAPRVQVAARLEALEDFSQQPLATTPVPTTVAPPHNETKAIAPAVVVPVEAVAPLPADQTIPVTPNTTTIAVTRAEHCPPTAAPLPSLRPRVQLVPQIFPRPSSAGPVAAAVPQPAPQVTVTIGRVEIRAAAPAVQAPLPATNSRPPLSLDTYLRQRASRSA